MSNRYDEDSDWSTALIDMINRPGVQREIEEQDKFEEADLSNSENMTTERSACDASKQIDG